MADRLDVVAVGVAHERAVVVGVVLGPHAGLVQHLGTVRLGRREERVDGSPIGDGTPGPLVRRMQAWYQGFKQGAMRHGG